MATYWENSGSFGLRNVSWYKYLIVSLVFSHLGFWSGSLFLIASFPDLCLLVLFCFQNSGSGVHFSLHMSGGIRVVGSVSNVAAVLKVKQKFSVYIMELHFFEYRTLN